jgi:hypothetical protein
MQIFYGRQLIVWSCIERNEFIKTLLILPKVIFTLPFSIICYYSTVALSGIPSHNYAMYKCSELRVTIAKTIPVAFGGMLSVTSSQNSVNMFIIRHLLSRWSPFSAYPSALKMEATYTYEASAYFKRYTRRYVPQNSSIQAEEYVII